ncbi:hypothetical protein CCR85_04080 [Rhodothalassium salexigens]|uniref:hypothetical protein n=1 Tax=Rhodothalassium salexigens TaxID=1086 RepID=UPI0019115D06|nr:hypothetical protein [Rhodothalassium salexigens]MBK5910670.1 hypothetical protein [Rhodothalassium salexigens]MBK5920605.1 hypothetical protein [Rhodothalassium salexigens]
MAAGIWPVPAERLKAGKAHRVSPASPRSATIITSGPVRLPGDQVEDELRMGCNSIRVAVAAH